MHLIRRTVWSVAACTLAVTLGQAPLSRPVSAQTSSTVEGTVVDERGAPIAGAQVVLTNRSTGESRHALTHSVGGFRILAVKPGTYVVTASALGFRSRELVAELALGQRVHLGIELGPEAIELPALEVEAVRVSANEIGRMSVSAPVLEQEIRHLPLSTRSAMDLAGLVPGIRSFRPLGGHSLPAAGALRGERFINLYVDGVELKNLYDGNLVGFPQTGSPLPADAIREFRVYLTPYDAAYARGAAYVLDAVTHRGTNDTRGSVFGFLQPRGLVAENDFLRGLPSSGGADFRRHQAGFSLRGPLVEDRLFYAATYEQSDTRSYIAVVPGRPAYDPGIWDDYAGVFVAPRRNRTGLLRLTWAPHGGHNIDAIGSVRHLVDESRFGGSASHEGRILDRHLVVTFALNHRWLVSQRLANELSLQVVDWSNGGRALAPQPALSFPGLRTGAPAETFELDERHLRLVNRVTWAIGEGPGSHLLSAGVEIARVGIDNFFPNLARASFDFSTDSATLPRQARISVGWISPDSDRDAFTAASGWVTGVYLQHEWRPVPSLALSLGLRHDAELGLRNNDFTMPWASDPELAALPELQPYLNRGERGDDLGNVSPRVAFSWDVSGDARTFVRGGFGIIHDRVPTFIAFQERRDATWRTYVFDEPGTTDPHVLRERVVSGEGRLASFTLMANDMEAPESRQASIGLGHRITAALVLNVDYVHQDVRKLFAVLNLNWLDRSRSPPRRVLSPGHGDMVVWDDFARARYRALLAQVTYQPAPDVRWQLAYTLGHAEAEWDGANQSVPSGAADRFYVMQRTSGDERHRIVLSGLVPLPFGLGASLIATAASPRPYLAIVGQDLDRNGFVFDDWIDGRRYLVPPNRWKHWYRMVDVRVARETPLPGGRRMSIVAEAFNLFNSVSYSSYQGRQLQPGGAEQTDFRRPTGVFGTRQLQLGVRLDF